MKQHKSLSYDEISQTSSSRSLTSDMDRRVSASIIEDVPPVYISLSSPGRDREFIRSFNGVGAKLISVSLSDARS